MFYSEKLSIIIPTKNRQEYAYQCVKTILDFDRSDVEIVIQDNSDDTSLKNRLQGLLNDSRLVYNHNSEVLSFCANFERAVEIASGDYIIMIGDDDCVVPQICELIHYLRKNNIDAATYSTDTTYKWPNAINSNEGVLVIRDKRPYIRILSTVSSIDNMMNNGNYDYQHYNFPKIYHGIVKRNCLDKVKEKTGHYFGGLTPDIYSAVSLSYYIKKILYINYPFSILGTCAKSGTADSLTGRHTGELSKAPHFRGTVNYIWEKQIPYIYTVDTIWAETALKAMIENGDKKVLTRENYIAFFSLLCHKFPQFSDRFLQFYKGIYPDAFEEDRRLIDRKKKTTGMKRKIRKMLNAFVQVLHGRHVYKNVNDIHDCVVIVNSKLNNFDSVFDKLDRGFPVDESH